MWRPFIMQSATVINLTFNLDMAGCPKVLGVCEPWGWGFINLRKQINLLYLCEDIKKVFMDH